MVASEARLGGGRKGKVPPRPTRPPKPPNDGFLDGFDCAYRAISDLAARQCDESLNRAGIAAALSTLDTLRGTLNAMR